MAKPKLQFHEAWTHAREHAFILQSAIAADAGVTVALIAAMELGHVPTTRAVYDVVVARFPHLAHYPRPGPDPNKRLLPRVSPVVTMEYQRVAAFHNKVMTLNVGRTNKGIIRDLLVMARRGDIDESDIDRYFT